MIDVMDKINGRTSSSITGESDRPDGHYLLGQKVRSDAVQGLGPPIPRRAKVITPTRNCAAHTLASGATCRCSSLGTTSIEMGIPNITNRIDGHFSQLKRMLRNHNGMKRKRRDKLVVGFFEASKGKSR